MPHAIYDFASLFFAGLLAGEELLVCYGLRAALASMDDQAHIRMRQALILRLRVLVPGILLPTIVCAGAVLILDRAAPGIAFRWASAAAMIVFIAVTASGTVPINQAALDWKPESPPDNWKAMVRRWEQLDVVRCWAALVSFGCLLAAAALRLGGS